METKSEEKLILAAQENRLEFLALYELHVDAILSFLIKRCRDKDLAEDICSETFMIAINKIDKFVYTGAPFRSWLYRIAINELNKYYKKNKREWTLMKKSHYIEEVSSESADQAMKDAEEKGEEKLDLMQLNDAFNRMKESEQNLLALRYFEDKSYKEIAGILDLSVSNVGVRINRALKKLKRYCPLDLLKETNA